MQKKGFRTLLKKSDVPLVVYAVVFLSMAISWTASAWFPDLALNLFSELVGAAFTLFIVDALLVRSKTRRWMIVREHIDYLISRDVNRIRDGVATRAFKFEPELESGIPEHQQISDIRKQRASLLTGLEIMSSEHFFSKLQESDLFSVENYEYFREKADDIWDILNMKYSEYLEPELVSNLIELHTNLKDVCGHIRQYHKADRYPEDQTYYHTVALKGAAISLKEILRVVNYLKEEGYSRIASLTEDEVPGIELQAGR